MNTTHRAIIYRIYPNKAQEELIQKTFGCCRFVYNKMLDVYQERYEKGEKFFTKYEANNYVNRVLKVEYPFLKEVDKFAVSYAVHNLYTAYMKFFNHQNKFPHYKKKRCYEQHYKTIQNVRLGDNFIQLPKVGKVKAKIHRQPKDGWELKYTYVTQLSNGTYQVSVVFLCPDEEKNMTVTYDNTIGLDYKMNGLYMDSNGYCPAMPQYFRQSLDDLKKRQRQLNHKKVGSKNYQKQQRKISRIHRHIANQRKDFLHKESTSIAKKYALVCVENLDMIAMSHNKYNNGMSVMDSGYSQFLRMLEYKCQHIQYVDRTFPSSQLCSCCGYQNTKLRDLSVRLWTCPMCRTKHDRDINASINIKNEGYKLFTASLNVA